MNSLVKLMIVAVLALTAACGPRADATSPEMLQSMLKMRGFNYTEEDFFRAARLNDAAAVRAFVQSGMNPNAKDKRGETILNYAIQNSDLGTVKVLLETADINLHDDLGNSPLYWAVKKEKKDIFKLLLERNVDPNSVGTSRNTKNQSALFVAVLWNDTELVKKLLEKGADPNLADSDGAIPLHDVVARNRPNMEIFKMLLERGSNVNKQESNGSTPLIYAAGHSRMDREAQLEIVKALLEKGADRSLRNQEGLTALDRAKKNKNKEVIEFMKK